MSLSDSDLSDLTDAEEQPLVQSQNVRPTTRGTPAKQPVSALFPPRACQYSMQSLHAMLCQGSVDLNPEYQRDVVWTDDKQKNLIDSVLQNFFIPPIIFAVQRNSDGTESRTCIDGKQRLTSILRFMNGDIDYRDSMTGQKAWYTKDTKSRKRVLPESRKMLFSNKQLTCVEYDSITMSQEREIFQRVQNGVALRPAERLKAVPGIRTDLTSEVKSRLNEDLCSVMKWDVSRGRDFQGVASVLCLIERHLDDPRKAAVEPTVKKLELWLLRSTPISETMPGTINYTFTILIHLFEDPKLTRLMTPAKATRMSPLEFCMIGFLIYVHYSSLTLIQLARAIRQMRDTMRSKFESQTEKGRTAAFRAAVKFVQTELAKQLPANDPEGHVPAAAAIDIPAVSSSAPAESAPPPKPKKEKVTKTSPSTPASAIARKATAATKAPGTKAAASSSAAKTKAPSARAKAAAAPSTTKSALPITASPPSATSAANSLSAVPATVSHPKGSVSQATPLNKKIPPCAEPEPLSDTIAPAHPGVSPTNPLQNGTDGFIGSSGRAKRIRDTQQSDDDSDYLSPTPKKKVKLTRTRSATISKSSPLKKNEVSRTQSQPSGPTAKGDVGPVDLAPSESVDTAVLTAPVEPPSAVPSLPAITSANNAKDVPSSTASVIQETTTGAVDPRTRAAGEAKVKSTTGKPSTAEVIKNMSMRSKLKRSHSGTLKDPAVSDMAEPNITSAAVPTIRPSVPSSSQAPPALMASFPVGQTSQNHFTPLQPAATGVMGQAANDETSAVAPVNQGTSGNRLGPIYRAKAKSRVQEPSSVSVPDASRNSNHEVSLPTSALTPLASALGLPNSTLGLSEENFRKLLDLMGNPENRQLLNSLPPVVASQPRSEASTASASRDPRGRSPDALTVDPQFATQSMCNSDNHYGLPTPRSPVSKARLPSPSRSYFGPPTPPWASSTLPSSSRNPPAPPSLPYATERSREPYHHSRSRDREFARRNTDCRGGYR